MKPIEFLGTIFFNLMQIQPRQIFYTVSLGIAMCVVRLDMKEKVGAGQDAESNKATLKKLEYIRDNTHADLQMPLAIAEAIVASVPMEQWRKEFEGKDNKGNLIRLKGKSTTVIDIYRLLKESYQTSMDAVVDTITAYSSEYRLTRDFMADEMDKMIPDKAPDWTGPKPQ